jgi:hypothetical protein
MRYDSKYQMYDFHGMFSAEDVEKLERLARARSPRREEQKINKVLRDAIDLLYATKFGDRPLT